jgi:DNA-nicking Smr family endonuclease
MSANSSLRRLDVDNRRAPLKQTLNRIMAGEDLDPDQSAPIPLPIEGVLDLHTFRPRDVKEVVSAYLTECRARGILKVRLVHGKGTGQLRTTVHALLERMPEVESFALAGEAFGGWGATIVTLRPLPEPA